MTETAAEPSSRQGTLLVVEDDPRLLEALGYLFETRGWHVARARGGSRGLAIALEVRPDLIVTDLQLPGLSGIDLARELVLAGSEGIPVIAITAAGRELRDACEASGLFAHVLQKPIETSELLAAVSRSLDESRW